MQGPLVLHQESRRGALADRPEVALLDPDSRHVVEPGCRLTVRFHMDGAIAPIQEYVFDYRRNRDTRDLVTPDSPAGRAILGRGAGETVGYSVEGCSRYVEIEIIDIGSPRG